MSLGEELRAARTTAGLSQEEVAFRAGLDRAYISLLENDHKSPTVDTLIRLCAALGVRASALLARVEGGDEPNANPPDSRIPRPGSQD